MTRLRRTGENEQGFTLVEMLVVMTVFGLVIGLVYSVLLKVQLFASNTQTSAEAASQVRLALAQIDRQVRSGNVLYAPTNGIDCLGAPVANPAGNPTPNAGACMRVYTQANGAQRCVQWQVVKETDAAGLPSSFGPRADRSLLRSRSWAPTWQTDGDLSSWVMQARGLALASAVPAFTLQGAATAYSSRLLDVQFEAVDSRAGSRNTLIEASLSGRNTNYGYDAGLCQPAPPA